jgi:hypothetical protein
MMFLLFHRLQLCKTRAGGPFDEDMVICLDQGVTILLLPAELMPSPKHSSANFARRYAGDHFEELIRPAIEINESHEDFLPLLLRQLNAIVIRRVVISIVDDNVSIRKALKRLIESIGLAAHDYDSAQQLMVKRYALRLLPVFLQRDETSLRLSKFHPYCPTQHGLKNRISQHRRCGFRSLTSHLVSGLFVTLLRNGLSAKT